MSITLSELVDRAFAAGVEPQPERSMARATIETYFTGIEAAAITTTMVEDFIEWCNTVKFADQAHPEFSTGFCKARLRRAFDYGVRARLVGFNPVTTRGRGRTAPKPIKPRPNSPLFKRLG
jgi:hypothetical protein